MTLLDILDCMSFVRTYLRGELGAKVSGSMVLCPPHPSLSPLHIPTSAHLLCSPAFSPHTLAFAGAERKAFNSDVRALVESRYGRQPFDLQLETKLYVLEKVRLIESKRACE